MDTVFIIAHIQICVEASYELRIPEEYALYQVNSNELKKPEDSVIELVNLHDDGDLIRKQNALYKCYEIQMVEDTAIPQMEGQVLFQNEMNLYLKTKDGRVLHFFRIPLTRQVAAWCETTGRNSQTIHFRKEARDYFESAVGCFNAAAFENILYEYREFLFHCSYVDVGGEAVLFSAHSGGGKTTHALLWEQCGFGEIINGDRAVIEKSQIEDQVYHTQEKGNKSGFLVHGLPIAGSSNIFKNRSLPLRAIFMLEKSPVNEVVDMPPAKRFLLVLEQITIHTWDREFVESATEFVAELVQKVPVKLLMCRPDEGAVNAVREALNFL